ncbi:MAG: hypothetical protein J6O39_01340 [Treponema sp.]|nr:hypothetical protein [Treponema sp.]
MYRAEIIANQSVQDDIIEVLEENIPGILYTTVPLVTGRGKSSYKLGTSTWPETNFLMISYIEDEEKAAVKKIIAAVKEKFPDEGIKVFFVKSE